MNHIHVCLVSDQPIPNLTTVFQFKPNIVILLSTKDKEPQTKRLENVIKKYNYNVIIREILPYDINNVINVAESLINECEGCEVTINITGGTKIGTLGTFQSFFTHGKSIYYVNTRDNEIIKIYPEEEKIPINVTITIKDYLAVYGFRIKHYIKDDGFIFKRKEVTKFLTYLAVEHERLIGSINHSVHSYVPDFEKASYPIKLELPENENVSKLCKKLDYYGLANHIGRTTIKVNNPDTVKYLKGGWFEEYVYITARTLDVDEVKMNVEGEWDVAGKFSVKNEFDIMIAKKNRLFYISCKTVNQDRKTEDSNESISKKFLYELDALGDRALGLFGKKLLASARPINNHYVRQRAQSMGITLIDGKNIATLKENLKKWLSQ